MEKENQPVRNSIIFKTLNDVLHDSMIPYTEHVVMDRALPRVEDGLKPVQRRILYSMMELGVTPDKPYRKSARIVGDCMGKYHPHGDSSVYDAMVRMSQNFVLRQTLIDGHGNFGSMDGDSAAAMRYTEARLAPLALELLRDLDKNTVDFTLNFDDTLKEPVVLPGRFPNLLVNGATGIAVGVATNIPPHNLDEVIDGVCAYIKNPNITLNQMMKYIKAPDFPTGGIIVAGEGLKEAYLTGKGKITIEARTHIETNGQKSSIVITEMPYQTNKAVLLQKIVELKEKEKNLLSYIGEITDESDRNGLRAVINIKKDGNAKAILNYLLENTNLKQSYNINMVAIAGGKPKQMGLMEIISYYTEYQINVIVRRTKFELDTAEKRAHIVKGLLIAIKNIDEVIKIIKSSKTVGEAKERLQKKFALSEAQAQAILDMRIARLVNLEVKKLEDEYNDLQIKIKNYKEILDSKQLQENLLIKELKDVKTRFSSKRKTEIQIKQEEEQAEIFDFVADVATEPNYVVLSADHRIKRVSIKSSGKASLILNQYEIAVDLLQVNDNDFIYAFTNKGNCVKLKVRDLPLLNWKSKGDLLSDLNKSILFEEYIVKILSSQNETNSNILIYTKFGLAKTTPISDYNSTRSIFTAIKLKDDDEVINVEYDNENSFIIAITKQSYSLKFHKKELPAQKRMSPGTKIFKMQEDDEVIFAGIVRKTGSIVVVSSSGYAKKVPIGDYELTNRYRRGLKTISLVNKNDCLKFARFTIENFNLVIENRGKFHIINTDSFRYDTRISKGKQVEKTKFEKVFPLLDKTML